MMTVYRLLMWSNPQALIDLDAYQRRWYDMGIARPEFQVEPTVKFSLTVEPIEEIGELMRQAPSRSGGKEREV